MANLAQVATQQAAMRPLAVSLTLIGWDQERGEAAVHRVDPAGFYTGYYAVASGPKSMEAMAALEKLMGAEWFGETWEEAACVGLKVMQQVIGQKMAVGEVEVGFVDAVDEVFKRLGDAEIAALLEQLDRE